MKNGSDKRGFKSLNLAHGILINGPEQDFFFAEKKRSQRDDKKSFTTAEGGTKYTVPTHNKILQGVTNFKNAIPGMLYRFITCFSSLAGI